MTHIDGDRYVMIERDDFQGPPSIANPPRQKKLYLFDLSKVDTKTGILKKRLLVDLLNIDDPEDIGGPLPELADRKFSFPLQSVESVTPIDDFTLLVVWITTIPAATDARRARRTEPRSSPCVAAFRSALSG